MAVPLDCSHIWRGILKARESTATYTQAIILNGRDLSFWHDPWSPMGILRDKFETHVRQRSRIRDSAKVCNFISNGVWTPPVNIPEEMIEVWGIIQTIRLTQVQECDRLIWMPHPRGNFTIRTAYAVFRSQHPRTPWTRLFWNGSCIPRQATIAWMAVQDSLMTQDRLVQWGSLKVSNCVLCNAHISDRVHNINTTAATSQSAPSVQKPDTLDITLPSLCDQQLFLYYKQVANSSLYYWNQQQTSSSASPVPENAFHLFFECSFSSTIWTKILAWCGINRKYNNPAREWKWIIKRLQGQSLHKILIQTALAATIYWIWGERNARIFKKQSRRKQQLISLIIRDVKIKMGTIHVLFADTSWNRFAAQQIGQHMNIVQQQQQQFVSWFHPPNGWVALNTDGALSDQGTGYAGILRDEYGIVLHAYIARSITKSVLFLEMIAVEKGLQLAKEMGIKKIMVQTDSKQVSRILNDEVTPTWRVESMAQYIKSLRSSFEEVTFHHVYRETNKVADALATTYPDSDEILFFAYPMGIVIDSLLVSDANGTLYTRM